MLKPDGKFTKVAKRSGTKIDVHLNGSCCCAGTDPEGRCHECLLENPFYSCEYICACLKARRDQSVHST